MGTEFGTNIIILLVLRLFCEVVGAWIWMIWWAGTNVGNGCGIGILLLEFGLLLLTLALAETGRSICLNLDAFSFFPGTSALLFLVRLRFVPFRLFSKNSFTTSISSSIFLNLLFLTLLYPPDPLDPLDPPIDVYIIHFFRDL